MLKAGELGCEPDLLQSQYTAGERKRPSFFSRIDTLPRSSATREQCRKSELEGRSSLQGERRKRQDGSKTPSKVALLTDRIAVVPGSSQRYRKSHPSL